MPFPSPNHIPGLTGNIGKTAAKAAIGGSIIKGIAETVAPVGGALSTAGTAATLLTTGLFLGISEGLFTRKTAKTGLDEIDPNLLNPIDRQRFYPSSTQDTGEVTIPSRTEQGFGDVVGAKYEALFEYQRDLDSGDPPVRQWFDISGGYRGPIEVNNVHFSSGVNTSANRNGFPEVYATGRGGTWFIEGTAHDENGNPSQLFDRTPGQSGIFTPSVGRFLNLRPVGGQPEPVTTGQQNSEPSPSINYDQLPPGTLAVHGSESTLNKFLNLIETGGIGGFKANVLRNNPASESQDVFANNNPATSNLSSGNNQQTANIAAGIVGLATGLGLSVSNTVPAAPPSSQNVANTKASKVAVEQKIKVPEEKVTYRVIGNSATGYKTLKTTETTDSNGIKTSITINPETGGIVGSIKRIIPAGVKTTNLGLDSTPFDLNDDNKYIQKENSFSQGRAKLKEFGTVGNFSNLIQLGTLFDGIPSVNEQPKIIGTPTNTGTGVKVIPTATEVNQTSVANSLDQPTLKSNDIAQIGALIAATPLLTQAVFTETVETATCNSVNNGCVRTGIINPLANNQNNLAAGISAIGAGLGAVGDASIFAVVQNTNSAVRNSTYGLQAIQNFASNAWSTLKIDKMLNVLNTALLVHNAAMLSRDIGSTVGEVVDNTLGTLGLKIKDAKGEEVGFTEVVGQTAKSLIESIIGADNYANLTASFARANRIYQASVNVLSNVRNIIDSTQDIAETTGENVSTIGNALKRGGVIRENAFDWMPENMQPESRWIRRLEKISDTVDVFEDITSDTKDIAEELNDLKENKKTFDKTLKDVKKEITKEEKDSKGKAVKTPNITEEDNLNFTIIKEQEED